MSEPLRGRLSESLKMATKAKDKRAVSTLRLILAALKDRDIAARGKGGAAEGIGDDEVLGMLQTMIKQRRESIKLYEKGERADLVEQEQDEIKIIEGFLPEQKSEAEISEVVAQLVAEAGADSIKDMGRVMALLRERYAGQMDFAKASSIVKDRLA